MPISATLVGARGTGTGTAVTTAVGTTSASGSSFFVPISYTTSQGAPTSITDIYSNTYSFVTGSRFGGGGVTEEWWAAQNGSGGADHKVTAHFATGAAATVHLIEVTGAEASGIDAVTGENNVNGHDIVISVPASGSFAQADELILAITGSATKGPVTPIVYSDTTATFTKISEQSSGGTFYTHAVFTRVIASTAAITTGFTNDNTGGPFMSGAIVSIKQAAAASGPTATFSESRKSGDVIAATTSQIAAATSSASMRGVLVASATLLAGTLTSVVSSSAGAAPSSSALSLSASSLSVSSGHPLVASATTLPPGPITAQFNHSSVRGVFSGSATVRLIARVLPGRNTKPPAVYSAGASVSLSFESANIAPAKLHGGAVAVFIGAGGDISREGPGSASAISTIFTNASGSIQSQRAAYSALAQVTVSATSEILSAPGYSTASAVVFPGGAIVGQFSHYGAAGDIGASSSSLTILASAAVVSSGLFFGSMSVTPIGIGPGVTFVLPSSRREIVLPESIREWSV